MRDKNQEVFKRASPGANSPYGSHGVETLEALLTLSLGLGLQGEGIVSHQHFT